MSNTTYIFRRAILNLMMACVALAGCGIPQGGSQSTTENPATNRDILVTEPSNRLSGSFSQDSAAKWPEYIPDVIPVLEGQISTVLEAPESHIRIFYDNVSEKQVMEYLDLLESMGFDLEYRIYVQEGFPDNSEERAKQGDFDAVDITRGEYHMNITYGANPVYDIYTSGFREEALAASALQWPPELLDTVPQIPRCALQTINPSNLDGYHITCREEDENVEQDYKELLLAAGFEEKNRTEYQHHVIEVPVFESDEAIVISSGLLSQTISIEVIIKSEPLQLQWPDDLAGLVPQPEQCEIESILPVSTGNYLITCTPADENALPIYLNSLADSGFVETNRMVGMDDEILSVTLHTDSANVQLMNSTMNANLMINVELN